MVNNAGGHGPPLTAIYQFMSSTSALVAVIGFLAAVIASFSIRGEVREKRDSLAAQVEALQDCQVKTLREMLAEARQENAILTEKLDKIESMLDDIETELSRTKQEKVALEVENDKLKKALFDLQEKPLSDTQAAYIRFLEGGSANV